MYYFRMLTFALLSSLIVVSPGLAGKRKTSVASSPPASVSPLDRIAFAVDGAESSHGADQGMWRLDLTGPEGPMQVSEAAASDVGGGDRFDLDHNREIGRAYLAQLYRRYGDWPDAIAAYNWGIGHLNAWLKAGRPPDGLVPEVAAYLGRVMRDSGLCQAGSTLPPQTAQCADLARWSGVIGSNGRYIPSAAPSPFYTQLDRALRLATEHTGSP